LPKTGDMMIIQTLTYLFVIGVVFVFMEGVAWFLHKYVMHGFGWFLHKDHHEPRKGTFEKNDVFGVFFSLISFALIFSGTLSGFDIKLAFGIGVMLYGIGYFLVHDVFFHKRIKIKYRPNSKYIKRILHAHAVHHAKSTAKDGVCFGFLYANKKYEI